MSMPNYNIVYAALPFAYDEDQEGYVVDEEHKAYLDRLAAAQPDHPSRGNRPFPFMKLSAELRNKIYDLATDIDVYRPKIRPQAGDEKSPRWTRGGRSRFARTRHVDPEYRYIFVGQGPKLIGHQNPAKPTSLPGILGVSKQVREEALSMYYAAAGNWFVFYGCKFDAVAKWITDTVGNNKCHLHCVVWQGREAFSEAEIVAVAAMYLLGQMGPLKNLQLCLCNTAGVHGACGANQFMKGRIIDGKAFGKTKEELSKMTFAELKALLGDAVLEWWRDTPFKDHKMSSECPVCTPSIKEQTAVQADME
ncbi:hypothetical protein HII31_06365 [Pseudocercospora fuligena]|uniref:Uncharacterized protein n=1 Tax=Pseudocercospora fuligena TaxID=685502 RepID=A0A8H6RJL3_9PEZI|nr:hypothetical protein HII31_06365 [Pseudocercospora fuligena]